MFTGIVEELGAVTRVDRRDSALRLAVRGALVRTAAPGDSIAVDGVCLTVTDRRDDEFTADVMAETVRRTTLDRLRPGDAVNLERAATLATRLGGHLVQGHVDGVGTVVAREPGEAWETVVVEVPAGLARYVVEKGSVTLDGVSLTVANVDGARLTVGLIPETLRRTTLGRREPGAAVNVEVDVLAKYVERLLAARDEAPLPTRTGEGS